MYTEAQKKASLKYQAKKAQVKITVDKEKRDSWNKYAAEHNISLTELITNLLDNEINKDIHS